MSNGYFGTSPLLYDGQIIKSLYFILRNLDLIPKKCVADKYCVCVTMLDSFWQMFRSGFEGTGLKFKAFKAGKVAKVLNWELCSSRTEGTDLRNS